MSHPDRHLKTERTHRGHISPVNLAAAEWLERLADDLEVGEPALVRRIAAYKLAAAGLRSSPLRVDELWLGGREPSLTRIEHVTPAIAQLLGELITTKRIALPAGGRSRPHSR